MASSVIFEERVEIPYFRSLAEFRAWALSDSFPERGRIDYIGGRIEVDMSPENLFFHGSIKTEVVGELRDVVRSAGGGYLFSDRTRVSSPDADLSAEPDVVYLSAETIDSGRVRLVPSAAAKRTAMWNWKARRTWSWRSSATVPSPRTRSDCRFPIRAPGLRSTGWSMRGGSVCSSASTPAARTVMSRRRWTGRVSSFRRFSAVDSVSNVAATPAAAGSSTSSRSRDTRAGRTFVPVPDTKEALREKRRDIAASLQPLRGRHRSSRRRA